MRPRARCLRRTLTSADDVAGQFGLQPTGPNGLLKLFTKNVLEAALSEETTEQALQQTGSPT